MISALEEEMLGWAKKLQFEKAAAVRDKIRRFKSGISKMNESGFIPSSLVKDELPSKSERKAKARRIGSLKTKKWKIK